MDEPMLPAAVLAAYAPHDDTIGALLRTRRERRPSHEALQFEKRSWSYAELDRASDRLAAALAARGVRKGDRVALLAPNSDLVIVLFLALAKAGAVFVPVNPALTVPELKYIVGHCGARLLLAEATEFERAEEIAATLPHTPVVLSLDDLGAAAADARAAVEAIETLAGAAPAVAVAVGADDPAIVIYTSGTTGLPKGVVHSQRNYVWAGEAFVERLYLQPEDRLLTVLPFYHINALFYSCGGALACGGTLVTAGRFSASSFWNLAVRTGATEFNVLAALGSILAKRPRSEFRGEHRITKVYGGPISAEMARAFQEDFHIPELIEGYGMSEIPGACNNPFVGTRKLGSIGRPARHPRFGDEFAKMRIVDDAGNRVAGGQVGEIVVKTPIVMLGYLNDPEQTRAAFTDGWFRTGDLAWQDEEGYFFFVTRKKDIIRRRGENISGAELDRVLGGHPDILEAAAIGVPSELGEEEILAVLVARPGQKPTETAIVDWCAQHLAAMKVPRYIVFVEEMPHSASHRVAKFRLKEEHRALLARAFDRERMARSVAPGRDGDREAG